jgi:hypothetical protein
MIALCFTIMHLQYINNATITVLAEMGQLANHDGRAKKSGQAHD